MIDAAIQYSPQLLRAAQVTVIVWALSAVCSAVLALVGGVGRLSRRRPVRWISGAYIEVFRGTSVLVQMFWFFFALPILLGVSLSPVTAGVLAISMNIGAYGSEVVRGSIQAVPKGQYEAATAMNFTAMQRLRRVVLPQAVPMMLPPFGNLLIEMLKTTALVSAITVTDLTFQAQQIRARTGDTVEVFTLILVMYFVLSQIIAFGMRRLEKVATVGARPSKKEKLPEPAA